MHTNYRSEKKLGATVTTDSGGCMVLVKRVFDPTLGTYATVSIPLPTIDQLRIVRMGILAELADLDALVDDITKETRRYDLAHSQSREL